MKRKKPRHAGVSRAPSVHDDDVDGGGDGDVMVMMMVMMVEVVVMMMVMMVVRMMIMVMVCQNFDERTILAQVYFILFHFVLQII